MLTVFTPTYNRAYTLPKLYKSLLAQTNKNFIWLLIDDGSTDNTKSLVQSWIDKGQINIQYIFQKNQGMHGAHNTAYKSITTELNVCIDSDDYMPDDAVDLILDFWKEKASDKVAGIVGLDATINGNIIGTTIPQHINKSTLGDLYHKHKILGDKKLVLRTEVVKKYPTYPIFKDEKFVPLGYLYNLIDQDYPLLTLNEVLCIVEYMPDGSSMNIFKQYVKNPKGFAFSRIARMENPNSCLELIKNTIHYVSSSIFSNNKDYIKESQKKCLTLLVTPIGILLYIYLKFKVKY